MTRDSNNKLSFQLTSCHSEQREESLNIIENMQKTYYVYIATNKNNTVLYTGMTSNLEGRMWQHKNKVIKGFTFKYNINKLIFYETFSAPQYAIMAEKKIKGWTRKKKIDLIKKDNPTFRDLIEM